MKLRYALILLLTIILTGRSFAEEGPNYFIGKIIIAGNRITKDRVITREILFAEGDTIKRTELNNIIKASEESLLNTALFNFVSINTIEEYNGQLSVFIIVEERWYIWPYPILEHADRNLSSFLKEQDWRRINYGVMLDVYNFRGLNERLKLKFRLGYKQQFQIAYGIPYLTKNKKHGLGTEFAYYKQNEIAYNTNYDQLVFYRDDIQTVKESITANVIYKYRVKHYNTHGFNIGYSRAWVQDTILQLNPDYFNSKTSLEQFLSLRYSFTINRTNAHYYPLYGKYLYLELSQNGFGILQNEMRSTSSLTLSAYQYFQHTNRWFSGLGAKVNFNNNRRLPYAYENGLGFDTYLRGYEYYVINGQQYATTRSFVKFAVIPRKVIYIEQWKWEKFNKIHYSLYANIFAETGYVHEAVPNENNRLPNTFLASMGIGLDLTTYYDQVFRLEYTINKLGEHALYVHVKKAF